MATVTGGGSSTSFNLGSNEASSVGSALQSLISAGLTAGTITRTSPTGNPSTGAGLATVSTPGGQTNLGLAVTNFIVNQGGGSTTVVGNGGQRQSVLIDNTNTTFNTGGGSGSVVTGDGNNFIGTPTSGGGAFNIVTGAGNDTITAFTGQNSISAGAGNNYIGSGAAGTLSANSIVGGGTTGQLDIIVGAGMGSDTIYGSSLGGGVLIAETTKSVTFVGSNAAGAGGATVLGGSAPLFISLGTGGGLVSGGSSGGNTLLGGTGSASSALFGGGNGDLLVSRGTGSTLLVAGSGNETLLGTGGNTTFFTNTSASANTLVGSVTPTVSGTQAGNDYIVVGAAGSSTVDAGAGADIFNFTNRGAGGSTANVVINGFRPAEGDRIQLIGFASTQVGAITGTAASGGSTSVVLSDGTRVTFAGVTSLNSSNFV